MLCALHSICMSKNKNTVIPGDFPITYCPTMVAEGADMQGYSARPANEIDTDGHGDSCSLKYWTRACDATSHGL